MMNTRGNVKVYEIVRNKVGRLIETFPLTKENNGVTLSTGEIVDCINLNNDEYRKALQIGIESMIASGLLNLNTIIWKD